jgi:hypothetical protein
VRILEKPEDFFEDAQPFPRCARKLRTFETEPAKVARDGTLVARLPV